jgi:hypothetical protein
MTKHLRHNAFQNNAANRDGLETQEYLTVLGETETFEDLFDPSFWRHHATGRLKDLDVLRVRAADGSFDVFVTVERIIPGGAEIHVLSGRLPAKYHGMHSFEIRELLTKDEADFEIVKMNQDGRAVPRVEQLATGWRVVGNDNEVVDKDMKSKTLADNRLERYLRDLMLRMPTPAEAAAHKSAIEAREAEQLAAIARKSATPGRRQQAAA